LFSRFRQALPVALLAALTGCSDLPHDGPSRSAVRAGAHVDRRQHYALVDIDYSVIQTLAEHPATPLDSLRQVASTAPNDLISEGDSLSVSVFVAGSGPLIGGSDMSPTPPELLPTVPVGRDGDVVIPFAGQVRVAGLTPNEASLAIRAALRGKAMNPQVTVSVNTSPANSVSVIGEVNKPGRYPVSANSDRLLDAIALAGGPTSPVWDLIVMVSRDGQSATIPMADLMNDTTQNIRLAPHDLVRLIIHQRKVNALGGVLKDSEFPITDYRLSLAGAISRASGLDTNSADASSVFLFRFERPEVARALGVAGAGVAGAGVPIVYHLNLSQGAGYFLASKFYVQADDLIDVPRARSTEVQKFFGIVNAAASSVYQGAVISSAVP